MAKQKTQSKTKNLKKSQKKSKNNKNLIIISIVASITLLAIIIVVTAILIERNNQAHRNEKALEYETTANTMSETYTKFGESIGKIISEKGYTTENWTDKEINDAFISCIDKYNHDGRAIFNYYVSENIASTKATTKEIEDKISEMKQYIDIINSIASDPDRCAQTFIEIAEEKLAKAAAEKAAAEKEAAKKAARAEAAAKYELTYEKFINQIHEGMTKNKLREIYTGFDNQCTISTSSYNYEFYSCKLSSYQYKTASFAFRNNILTYKSQYGLK